MSKYIDADDTFELYEDEQDSKIQYDGGPTRSTIPVNEKFVNKLNKMTRVELDDSCVMVWRTDRTVRRALSFMSWVYDETGVFPRISYRDDDYLQTTLLNVPSKDLFTEMNAKVFGRASKELRRGKLDVALLCMDKEDYVMSSEAVRADVKGAKIRREIQDEVKRINEGKSEGHLEVIQDNRYDYSIKLSNGVSERLGHRRAEPFLNRNMKDLVLNKCDESIFDATVKGKEFYDSHVESLAVLRKLRQAWCSPGEESRWVVTMNRRKIEFNCIEGRHSNESLTGLSLAVFVNNYMPDLLSSLVRTTEGFIK